MPIDSSPWRMANQLTGGRLADLIASHRTAGLSYERISQSLLKDHGVEVSAQTIRSWHREMQASA